MSEEITDPVDPKDQEISDLKEALEAEKQNVQFHADTANELFNKIEKAKTFLSELASAHAVNGKIQFGFSVNARELLKDL